MFCTERFVESPTARMAITAPTPMMMPSIVSSDRVRLFHTMSNASAKNSSSLLMAQAFDGLEPARPHRRIGAEEQPDRQRRSQRQGDDRQPVDAGGDAGELDIQERARRFGRGD